MYIDLMGCLGFKRDSSVDCTQCNRGPDARLWVFTSRITSRNDRPNSRVMRYIIYARGLLIYIASKIRYLAMLVLSSRSTVVMAGMSSGLNSLG